VLNNTKTLSRPKLLFLVPAISQTHKSLENTQDFFVKTKTKTFTSRPRPRLWVSRPPRPRLYFLSSRRLETKTLVSRTTSLDVRGVEISLLTPILIWKLSVWLYVIYSGIVSKRFNYVYYRFIVIWAESALHNSRPGPAMQHDPQCGVNK